MSRGENYQLRRRRKPLKDYPAPFWRCHAYKFIMHSHKRTKYLKTGHTMIPCQGNSGMHSEAKWTKSLALPLGELGIGLRVYGLGFGGLFG